MFRKILESLREIFRAPTIYDSLEAYIVAGKPQTPDDVDRLEKEFHQRRQIQFFDRYY